MTDMVEPDRTILVVSIIGLVIIWGSFFYHKYVQGGGEPQAAEDAVPASHASAGEEAPKPDGAPEAQRDARRGKRKR